MKYEIKTFKMRCECESDAIRITSLLQQCSNSGWIDWLERKENNSGKYIPERDLPPARVTIITGGVGLHIMSEVEITSTLTFDELQFLINLLPDHHVAWGSLKPIEDYDGERDNDEKSYSKPNNIRPEFQSSEVIRRIINHLGQDIFDLAKEIGAFHPEYVI